MSFYFCSKLCCLYDVWTRTSTLLTPRRVSVAVTRETPPASPSPGIISARQPAAMLSGASAGAFPLRERVLLRIEPR